MERDRRRTNGGRAIYMRVWIIIIIIFWPVTKWTAPMFALRSTFRAVLSIDKDFAARGPAPTQRRRRERSFWRGPVHHAYSTDYMKRL